MPHSTPQKKGSTEPPATHRPRPSIPILVIAALGVVTGDLLAGTVPYVLWCAVGAVTAGGVCGWYWYREPVWWQLTIGGAGFLFGSIAAQAVYAPSLSASHVAQLALPARVEITGRVSAPPEPRPHGIRMRVDVHARWHDGTEYPATGTVLVSIRQPQRQWHAGDMLRASLYLRHPRNFGNPGEFDYERYLARQGIYVTGFAFHDAAFEYLGRQAFPVTARIDHWRDALRRVCTTTLDSHSAWIFRALVLGDARAVPRDIRDAFSRVGVSHVLAISGLHIGLVAAMGYLLFRWLLARSVWLLLTINVPKVATALSLLPVLVYAVLAGGSVATVRAVLMVGVVIGGVLLDRLHHLAIAIALAALVIILATPGSSREISFQLSFVAVIYLILGMQRFQHWWEQYADTPERPQPPFRLWALRWVLGYMALTISAIAATAPLIAFYFNQFSVMAVVANAVMVPLLGSIALPLGLFAAVVYPLSATLASLCLQALAPVLQLSWWIVETLAAIPGAAWRVATPSYLELGLWYLLCGVLVGTSGRRRVIGGSLILALLAGDAMWWYHQRHWHGDVRVTFLSVGQGDSTVVEFPGSHVMVIDGGGLNSKSFDIGERVIAPFLWSRKITHVDTLVLTHPQHDHYDGFSFLAEHFTPREIWSNGTTSTTASYRRLQAALTEQHVSTRVVSRGDTQEIDGVTVAVLSPPNPQPSEWGPNDRSVVLQMTYAGQRLLFTGDIEAAAEHNLTTTYGTHLSSAVLKVPHHGSRTSSHAELLRAVQPQIAVVSLGFHNRFGFPHPEVMARYRAHKTLLARTDIHGAFSLHLTPRGTRHWHHYRHPQ